MVSVVFVVKLEDVVKVGNTLLNDIELNIPIINNYQPAFNTNKILDNIRNKK